VRYWNNSLCLPQTALYNDNALQWLSELIWAVSPYRILQRCIALDCYPSEYLLLRDTLPLEDWSLVLGQVRPEVLALCFMSQYAIDKYRQLVLKAPSFEAYGRSSDAMSQLIYRQAGDEIDAQVAQYLPQLAQELATSDPNLDNLYTISPLKLLWLSEHGQVNLRTLFALCQSAALDACTLQMGRMNLYSVGFLHMATFATQEFKAMQEKMGPAIDPTPPVVDKPGLDRQMKIMAYALSAYVDGQVANLKTRDEADFSESEFKALFNL
jgi:hypothetical protein